MPSVRKDGSYDVGAGEHPVDAIIPGDSQKVAFDGSVKSAAIVGTVVRLVATSACHVAFGADPAAAADGTCVYLPAGVPERFHITSGTKIAAIKDSAVGNLFITVAE